MTENDAVNGVFFGSSVLVSVVYSSNPKPKALAATGQGVAGTSVVSTIRGG
jgi:hypothetical protein